MFPFKIKTTPNVIFFDSSVQFVESKAVVQKKYKEKHMLEMKILEIHSRKEMQNIHTKYQAKESAGKEKTNLNSGTKCPKMIWNITPPILIT